MDYRSLAVTYQLIGYICMSLRNITHNMAIEIEGFYTQ